MANKPPPDGFEDSGPPDGFEASGPPDGFEGEAPKTSLATKVGNVAMGALETVAAPFEMVGEAMRGAGEGEPLKLATKEDPSGFRAPSIVQRFAPRLQTEERPADPFTKAYQGLEGVVALPTGIQKASEVVTGKPDIAADIGGIALGVGTGKVGAAPLEAVFKVAGKAFESVAKPALTIAGKMAAQKSAGSLVARGGEELVSEVLTAAQTGDINKLSELVESGKTHLFYSEALKGEVAKAKSVAQNIDYLTDLKTSLETGKAQPLKARSAILKLEKVEEGLKNLIISDESKRIDALMARRDALVNKNFHSPSSKLESDIKALNQRISQEVKASDKLRVNKILDHQKQIEGLKKTMANDQAYMTDQLSNKVIARESQMEKLKTKIADRFVAPLEKDVVEGILRYDDSGLVNKYIRAPMQNLTFLTDSMDKQSNGAFSRYVTSKQIAAESHFDDLAKKYLNENANIYAKHEITPELDTSFRLYREGKAGAPAGLEDKFKAASADYTGIVKQRMADYNKTAKRIGMPEINPQNLTSENYVYHTKRMNALFDLSDLDMRDIPKDAMFIEHNDPIFHSYKRRYDAIPEEQLSGAFEALDKYSMNIAKVEAFGEQANKFRSLSRVADDFGKKSLAEQFSRIADRLTGDSGLTSGKGLEEATGGLMKPGLTSKVNQMASIFARNAVNSASAAIGNLGASVTNALYMGPRRATASIIEGMSKNLFEHIYKAHVDENYQLLARKYSNVIKIHGFERPETFLQRNPSPAQKLANIYQGTVRNFFNFMNDSMNIGTWNQAFKASKASGYSFDQSVKVADNLVARTQAIYREAFRPSAVSSPLGKIAIPLSTYVFNSVNALSQDVLFNSMPILDKTLILSGALATAFITNVMTKAATGKSKIDTGDFVPFLRSFQYGLGGLAVPGQAYQDIKKGHYLRGAVKVGAMLTPYGSAQIPITMRGIEAIRAGKTKGLLQGAQAVVFGPRKQEKK